MKPEDIVVSLININGELAAMRAAITEVHALLLHALTQNALNAGMQRTVLELIGPMRMDQKSNPVRPLEPGSPQQLLQQLSQIELDMLHQTIERIAARHQPHTAPPPDN